MAGDDQMGVIGHYRAGMHYTIGSLNISAKSTDDGASLKTGEDYRLVG